jgi:hypothetical protein
MDNLSAATITSGFWSEALTAFMGFIQRRLFSLQGWRLAPELSGGMKRNQVAACAGIRSRRNPVDLVAPGRVSMITDSTAALLAHADLDAIVLLGMGYMTSRATRWLASPVLPREAMAGPAQKMIEGEMELVDLIVRQIREFNKPIIPVVDVVGFDEPGDLNIVRRLDAQGVMAYSSPDQAIRALAKAQKYYSRRQAENQSIRKGGT